MKPLRIGIVGHEAKKFTPVTEHAARNYIRSLLAPEGSIAVSGHCHLGGIDIIAEEVAKELGRETMIFPPKVLKWEGGYKQRNLQIAKNSDVVYSIVVSQYPPGYSGAKFGDCYHCGTKIYKHVKSGGCWTAKKAMKAIIAVIDPDGLVHSIPLIDLPKFGAGS